VADIFDTRAVAVAGERTTLEAFLDYYRAALVRKVRGLSDEEANRRLVPSATTLASLVKHMARVEMSWFQHRLAQTPLEELPFLQRVFAEPDSDFEVEPGETVDVLLERYERQCALSREIAEKIPGARLQVLEHGGHGMNMEFAADVNGALLAFLTAPVQAAAGAS
jgi:pimeloyl-ACP methyl ester carboxylesterase